jgi:hypothetical protein
MNRLRLECALAALFLTRRWFREPAIYVVQGDGLGNQLHRHAFALALATRTGLDVYTLDQCFALDMIYKRTFELPSVGVSTRIHRLPWHGGRLACYLDALSRNRGGFHTWVDDLSAQEVLEKPPRRGKRFILRGYFQKPPLLDSAVTALADAVRRAAQDRIGDYTPGPGTVAVHFRRVAFGQVLGPDYYRMALATLDSEEKADVHAFGDELPDWLSAVVGRRRLIPVVRGEGVIDFLRISRFQRVCAANSTFSFWAGLLGGAKMAVPAAMEAQIALPRHCERIEAS